MSWTAHLDCSSCGRGDDWNYTHNCNRMANAVLPSEDYPETWWRHLDGLEGPDGAALLDRIIKGLEAEPERFRDMNPENGWGSYESFLGLLMHMRDAVGESPSRWTVNG